jgi:peptide/nickel transport system substrate-binding protein
VRATSSRHITLITLAIVFALGAESAGQGVRELRVGVPGLPARLDPATALTGATPLIARLVFDTLVTYRDGSTDIAPGLATRWTVSRDGLTWSFTLREDVRFHDGTPLTARATVASLERQTLPGNPREPKPNVVSPALLRGLPGVVKGFAAPDERTIQIVLVQPYAPLVSVLAHPGFGIVHVAVGQNGADAHLVGTGAYRVSEITPGRLVLDAVRPVADSRAERVVFEDVATDDQAGAAFASQALDVWFPAQPPRQLDGTLSIPGTRVGFLAMQTEKEPFSRKKVRQAIAAALDPALILQGLDRAGVPLPSFLPPGIWGRRDAPVLRGDPTTARKFLAEAGWTRRTPPTLLVAAEPGAVNAVKVAESIAASLAAANLAVVIRAEPLAAVRELTQAGDFELAITDTPIPGGDPHLFLYPLSTTEGAARGPHASNISFYRNRRLDDLLIRASQVAFRPERARLYGRAQALLADELPWIPIYVDLHWAVIRPGIGGLRLHPTGFHRLDTVTLQRRPDSAP